MSDGRVVRDLATRYAELAADPVQDERRDLWRRHNSLQPTRPLVFVRGGNAFGKECVTERDLRCTDPFLRGIERSLRLAIFRAHIGDDWVSEPWISVQAVRESAAGSPWGMIPRRTQEGYSWHDEPPLKEEADLDRMVVPRHRIDEPATADQAGRARDALGDILAVNVQRAPHLRGFGGDISYWMGYLRGAEQIMWDMADRPAWFHRFAARLRDGILKVQREADEARDWRLADHDNQAIPYSNELRDPAANSAPVPQQALWGFFAAQEFALISPAMHDEFLLRYQRPIMERFALTAYGCCEDLTRKIDLLRGIPNLRRIAVTQWANLTSCAEQIGTDYVISWRPRPADVACERLDAEGLRGKVREAFELCRGLHVDVTLKDITTVNHHPGNLAEWARVVKDVAQACG